jgi:alcohol dehydrogenase class IV
MLAAASMGHGPFQKGLGAIHALSHPVGALYGVHHGLTNAVIAPYVLDFNRDEIEAKIDRLAGWLGLEGGFAGFMDFLLRLRRDLGIPHTMDKIGVDEAQLRPHGRDGGGGSHRGGNPRLLTEADARDLYDRALNGRLG